MLTLKIVSRLITVFLSLFFLAGCRGQDGWTVHASSSPLASTLTGKWTGKSDLKDKEQGAAVKDPTDGLLTMGGSMTLNADGTGFLKIEYQAEKPIVWKQEGDKVILASRSFHTSSDKVKDAEGWTWVATLSPDGKSLIIDMGTVKVPLNKQP